MDGPCLGNAVLRAQVSDLFGDTSDGRRRFPSVGRFNVGPGEGKFLGVGGTLNVRCNVTPTAYQADYPQMKHQALCRSDSAVSGIACRQEEERRPKLSAHPFQDRQHACMC